MSAPIGMTAAAGRTPARLGPRPRSVSSRDVTDSLDSLAAEIVACRACPRLVAWRGRVGREKRAAFRDEEYWARPLPGFGDPDPWLVVIGLAPAAHGANRTGRMFTGDRSGDFLVAALHRAGLASQPTSERIGDGLRLVGCRLTAAVRCAPPGNRPTPGEEAECRPFLRRELELCAGARVLLALGAFAWRATLQTLAAPRPWAKFGHGAEFTIGGRALIGSYHPSQQNTFTGKLTPAMLDAVLARAGEVARGS
jgi:uracil-DNA glycosylase family 4